jgi:uncharacterized protein YbcV (DUF1398 family)
MFSKAQIETATAKARTGADFPQLIQDLKAMGVTFYEHFVDDGANVYYSGPTISIRMKRPQQLIIVADVPSAELLKQSLSLHQQGLTDYPTFCIHAGDSGVEKWVSDLNKMTVTYYDKAGNALLVEPIPAIAA